MKLSRALKKDSALQAGVRKHTGAIERKHHGMIAEDQRARIQDSLDLDAATQSGREQEHRWDYLVSISSPDKLVGIEPHTAADKEIGVMVKKRSNAIALLREEFRPGFSVASWHWVAGSVAFSKTERIRRALDQSGIKFHGRVIRNLD
jgi:hypothetical protein